MITSMTNNPQTSFGTARLEYEVQNHQLEYSTLPQVKLFSNLDLKSGVESRDTIIRRFTTYLDYFCQIVR